MGRRCMGCFGLAADEAETTSSRLLSSSSSRRRGPSGVSIENLGSPTNLDERMMCCVDGQLQLKAIRTRNLRALPSVHTMFPVWLQFRNIRLAPGELRPRESYLRAVRGGSEIHALKLNEGMTRDFELECNVGRLQFDARPSMDLTHIQLAATITDEEEADMDEPYIRSQWYRPFWLMPLFKYIAMDISARIRDSNQGKVILFSSDVMFMGQMNRNNGSSWKKTFAERFDFNGMELLFKYQDLEEYHVKPDPPRMMKNSNNNGTSAVHVSQGHRRLEAVKAGSFAIYQCPLSSYWDALEVRYFVQPLSLRRPQNNSNSSYDDNDDLTTWVTYQEIFPKHNGKPRT